MTTRVARASMCALLTFLAIRTPATAGGPDPTSAYAKRSVQGFTVLVNRRVLEHKKEAAEALKEVDAQLGRIARVVPPRPLARLRKVRIWVEWASDPEALTVFHPSGSGSARTATTRRRPAASWSATRSSSSSARATTSPGR